MGDDTGWFVIMILGLAILAFGSMAVKDYNHKKCVADIINKSMSKNIVEQIKDACTVN